MAYSLKKRVADNSMGVGLYHGEKLNDDNKISLAARRKNLETLKSEQARQRGSVSRLFIFVVTVLTPATT
jgi:hypothetical protein